MVDSGADITIMGGEMFKWVAVVAKLKKKDFKPPDKTPRNYDQQPFHLALSLILVSVARP